MVIAYDVTSKKTFGNVDKWKEKVEERNEDNLEDLVTVLVGCKADLGDIREVGGVLPGVAKQLANFGSI